MEAQHLDPSSYLRRIAELEAQHAADQALIARLLARIAALEERLGLNSSNSHFPPSSDRPDNKPPRRKPADPKAPRRKRGAQPGHPGHKRPLLPPDKVDFVRTHLPAACADCGASLPKQPGPDDPPPLLHQVVDLPPIEAVVTEHQLHARCCTSCGAFNRAELPSDVPKGCVGPDMQAFMSHTSGRYGLSKRKVQDLTEELFGEKAQLSLGTISNMEHETSEALKEAYDDAVLVIAKQPILHFDETGWPEGESDLYMWTAVASDLPLTAYYIGPRSRPAFEKFMPGFGGIGHCDRYVGYEHLGERRQFCWPHLGRDFEAIALRGGDSAEVGKEGLAVHKALFSIWHRFKADELSWRKFRQAMRPLKEQLNKALKKGLESSHEKTRGTCKEILDHESCLWTFTEVRGCEPTNNAAEQALRRAVIIRKLSFGTQSRRGSDFMVRLLTVAESCRRQGRSALEFLRESIIAKREGRKGPSLLKVPSKGGEEGQQSPELVAAEKGMNEN